ncbi:PREDICTED: uncharacterized protein LOC109192670 [Ipomoea nil]|uniref:uncharacterized protein LOC109192670 n=1 Tax=Ipomoea nil TaxID=35883 RepID=UPI00090177EE|nr:PREDICTED: uncharacterized protein LOC109192670 [Ipomoea nil]
MLAIRKTVFSACLSSFHNTPPNIRSLAATFSSTVNKDDIKIIETPGRAKGKAADMDDARGEREERRSSVADSMREGAARAMETGMELGEKAKQTMDDAWDAAKETTKNVKDSMREDDEYDDDLRKRGGRYDLRDRH